MVTIREGPLSFAKPLPKLKMTRRQLDHQEQISWICDSEYNNFIDENQVENVVCSTGHSVYTSLC